MFYAFHYRNAVATAALFFTFKIWKLPTFYLQKKVMANSKSFFKIDVIIGKKLNKHPKRLSLDG